MYQQLLEDMVKIGSETLIYQLPLVSGDYIRMLWWAMPTLRISRSSLHKSSKYLLQIVGFS